MCTFSKRIFQIMKTWGVNQGIMWSRAMTNSDFDGFWWKEGTKRFFRKINYFCLSMIRWFVVEKSHMIRFFRGGAFGAKISFLGGKALWPPWPRSFISPRLSCEYRLWRNTGFLFTTHVHVHASKNAIIRQRDITWLETRLIRSNQTVINTEFI